MGKYINIHNIWILWLCPELGDAWWSLPSKCLTMPRRLLPWAAMSTRVPFLILGAISSFQNGKARAMVSFKLSQAGSSPGFSPAYLRSCVVQKTEDVRAEKGRLESFGPTLEIGNDFLGGREGWGVKQKYIDSILYSWSFTSSRVWCMFLNLYCMEESWKNSFSAILTFSFVFLHLLLLLIFSFCSYLSFNLFLVFLNIFKIYWFSCMCVCVSNIYIKKQPKTN